MDCLALPTVATLATRITYRLILHRSVPYSLFPSRLLPLYTGLVQNTLLRIFSFQCSWSGNKSCIVPLDLTYILYHIFWYLSSTFVKFLKNINSTCMHFLPLCLTVYILYHKGLNLSTPYMKFLLVHTYNITLYVHTSSPS